VFVWRAAAAAFRGQPLVRDPAPEMMEEAPFLGVRYHIVAMVSGQPRGCLSESV